MSDYPYIITISSEKGGVGKTTLATNLAVFIKALHEDLPVSILSFDNHFTIDRMFAIKGQPLKGNVADLLHGTSGLDLLHTGQYGVNYIPSSTSLSELKSSFKGPMVLARHLATSRIPGIVIIDTRPDLDIFTQNALYTADSVLIPIKDMPSMENCRNIFDLFDKRGLDKRSLSLIPCLIDERIKFDGPFVDQKTLLRAYAINRGYRCHDIFISKSPKVESLATNPEGKVFPVLTHGRGTDVYGQFTQLAKTFIDDYHATTEPRALLFHNWLSSENIRKKNELFTRLSGIKQECLICGKKLSDHLDGKLTFYTETSDDSITGFLDGNCFTDLLISDIYNISDQLDPDNPTRSIIDDNARDSVFAFKAVKSEKGASVEFHRFDSRGELLLKKTYPYVPEGNNGGGEALSNLIKVTLSGYEGSFREAFVMVHPVNNDKPEEILTEDSYREVKKLKKLIAQQLFN
jgi:cellulose biosynthesis protein BcsQ